MKPLTKKEIAHMRRAHAENEMSSREYRDALPRLLDDAERARALLKRIERKGGTYREQEACPACDAVEDDDETITHRPDCDLAALLEFNRQRSP